MLGWRLLGAVGLIVPLLLLLWMDDRSNHHPGVWLVPLAIAAAMAASGELVGLFTEQVAALHRLPTVIVTGVLMTLAGVPVIYPDAATGTIGLWGWVVLGLAMALGMLLFGEMLRFRDASGLAHRVAFGMFATVYVSIPICFLLYLRVQAGGRVGVLLIVSVIVIVKCSDSGAYFAGKAIGHRKMAPRISPNKTWEGALGGLVAAVLAALVYHGWIVPWLAPEVTVPTLPALALYAMALYVFGVLGDLSESVIKRAAGKKDSSGWLPGLGGLLDVIDSLLWTAPVAYFFWATKSFW